MLTDFHLLSGMSLAHRNKLHQLDGTLRAALLNASVESNKNQLGTINSLACQQMLNNSAIARTAPPSETTLSQTKYGPEDIQADTAFSQATTRQCVKEWSNGVEMVRNMSEAQAETLKAAISRGLKFMSRLKPQLMVKMIERKTSFLRKKLKKSSGLA